MSTSLTGGGTTNLDALAVVGAADFGTPTYGGAGMGRWEFSALQLTTSGTVKDFTPPSWARRITITGRAVSTSGTSAPMIQIGTGGTPTTSGYISTTLGSYTGNTPSGLASTTGFVLAISSVALNYVHFTCTLVHMGGNTWQQTSYLAGGGSQAVGMFGGGDITLSGTLDNVRFTTAGGTDTFDLGSIIALYEG